MMCDNSNSKSGIIDRLLFLAGAVVSFLVAFSLFEAADVYLESKLINEKEDVKD